MGEEQRPERGVVRDEKMGVMIVGEILGREGPATPKHVFPSSLPKSLPKGFYPGTVTYLIQPLLQRADCLEKFLIMGLILFVMVLYFLNINYVTLNSIFPMNMNQLLPAYLI